MRTLKSLSALLAVLVTAPALAGDPYGLFVGGRAGYGLPFGNFTADNINITGGDTISYVFGGLYPLQADLALRLPMGLELGPYFQWAAGQGNGFDCPDGVECSSSAEQLGLEVSYHRQVFATNRSWWVGLSGGLEWADQSVKMQSLDATSEFKGIAGALEAGFNYHFGLFEVGPYLSLVGGVYKQYSVTINGGQGSEDIRHQDLHGWIIFGLRGAVNLIPPH